MTSEPRRPVGKALTSGALSGLLYLLLYLYEEPILAWTTRGRWHFALPLLIAFVFSLFHGAFTGYFWEALGVRAQTPQRAPASGQPALRKP